MSEHTKETLENMLFDVVNELDLSEVIFNDHDHYAPLDDLPPAELVRLVLHQKDMKILALEDDCDERYERGYEGGVIFCPDIPKMMYSTPKVPAMKIGIDQAASNAARDGRLDVLKYLVKQGASLHAKKDLGMRLAALNGHLPVVKYIAEKGGADIDTSCHDVLAFPEGEDNEHFENNGYFDVIDYLKSIAKAKKLLEEHRLSVAIARV